MKKTTLLPLLLLICSCLFSQSCDKITSKKDKFSDLVNFFTPYTDGIIFMKGIKKGKTSYYFSIDETGSTLNVNGKGLYLLLDNGSKISRPREELDVEVASNGSGWDYSSAIKLSDDELNLLLKHSITDYKLYIYDGAIKDGYKLRKYLNCLVKMK